MPQALKLTNSRSTSIPDNTPEEPGHKFGFRPRHIRGTPDTFWEYLRHCRCSYRTGVHQSHSLTRLIHKGTDLRSIVQHDQTRPTPTLISNLYMNVWEGNIVNLLASKRRTNCSTDFGMVWIATSSVNTSKRVNLQYSKK